METVRLIRKLAVGFHPVVCAVGITAFAHYDCFRTDDLKAELQLLVTQNLKKQCFRFFFFSEAVPFQLNHR